MITINDFSPEQKKHLEYKIEKYRYAFKTLKPLVNAIVTELINRSLNIDGLEKMIDNHPGIRIETHVHEDISWKTKRIVIGVNGIEIGTRWPYFAMLYHDLSTIEIGNELTHTDPWGIVPQAKEVVDMLERRRGTYPINEPYAVNYVELASQTMDKHMEEGEALMTDQLVKNFNFAMELKEKLEKRFGKEFFVYWGEPIRFSCFEPYDNHRPRKSLWELELRYKNDWPDTFNSVYGIPKFKTANLDVYHPDSNPESDQLDWDQDYFSVPIDAEEGDSMAAIMALLDNSMIETEKNDD